MTEDQKKLAREATQTRGFALMVGMVFTLGETTYHVVEVKPDPLQPGLTGITVYVIAPGMGTYPYYYDVALNGQWFDFETERSCTPILDFTSEATGGYLLGLLGAARRYIRFGFGGQPQWQDLACTRTADAWTTASTLAEACVRVARNLDCWPGGAK